MVQTWQIWGLPSQITLDRDSRFIGSWSAERFASPVMKTMLDLGIQVDVCPPRHPQHNCYVELINRSDKEEAILIDLPQTLAEAQLLNETDAYHYNQQRPHQGLSCGNQPSYWLSLTCPPDPLYLRWFTP